MIGEGNLGKSLNLRFILSKVICNFYLVILFDGCNCPAFGCQGEFCDQLPPEDYTSCKGATLCIYFHASTGYLWLLIRQENLVIHNRSVPVGIVNLTVFPTCGCGNYKKLKINSLIQLTWLQFLSLTS